MLLRPYKRIFALFSSVKSALTINSRKLSTNMEQISDSKYEIVPKRGGIFQLWKARDADVSNNDALVIMFGFFGATQRVIAKYCDIFLNRGLPVLFVPSCGKHLVWPPYSISLGEDLMEYLDHEASECSNYLIHTISMGSYNFMVCNYEGFSKHPEKFPHIKCKIKAIVYDSIGFSIGSSENMIKGICQLFSWGISRNLFLQHLLPVLMTTYFYIMHKHTIERFEHWMRMWQTLPLEVPTLFFYCENDPLTNYKDIQEMIEGYKRIGSFPVLEKCWSESRHATHLMLHAADYLDYINRLIMITPAHRVQPKISESKL